MEIQQVDVVGAQALEAGLHRLVDPAARLALLVRAGRTRRREAELGGDHPAVAVVGDGASDGLLGAAGVIDVRGIDEVDALVARLGDDALRRGLIGFAAEHHCAQAQG
ncbi:hypothetical protein G6F59_016332 [Rhizopus arrhizus]|nr:hypothetical protein G6F59_016332 [Rhizopus arrhizus]